MQLPNIALFGQRCTGKRTTASYVIKRYGYKPKSSLYTYTPNASARHHFIIIPNGHSFRPYVLLHDQSYVYIYIFCPLPLRIHYSIQSDEIISYNEIIKKTEFELHPDCRRYTIHNCADLYTLYRKIDAVMELYL